MISIGKELNNYQNLKFKIDQNFLTTHSKQELKERLVSRNQNTKEEIDKRFNSFKEDIKHWCDYDYVLINQNLKFVLVKLKK